MKNNRKILLGLSLILLICCVYVGIRAGIKSNNTEYAANTKVVSNQSLGVQIENVTESAVGIVPSPSLAPSEKGKKKESIEKQVKPSTTPEKEEKNKRDSVRPSSTPKVTAKPNQGTCVITVDLRTVLSHMDELTDNQKELIPANGYLIQNYSVTFQAGDTVYSALKKACKENNIALDVDLSWTGYVKGIGNVYEKDLGSNSGWLYSVNGRYPNVGVNGYKLSSGDRVAFRYSCQRGDINE